MNHQHGERVATVRLPVTATEDLYARAYVDIAVFRRRQTQTAQQEKSRQGLQVASPEQAARRERVMLGRSLRAPHSLILNKDGVSCAGALQELSDADFRVRLRTMRTFF